MTDVAFGGTLRNSSYNKFPKTTYNIIKPDEFTSTYPVQMNQTSNLKSTSPKRIIRTPRPIMEDNKIKRPQTVFAQHNTTQRLNKITPISEAIQRQKYVPHTSRNYNSKTQKQKIKFNLRNFPLLKLLPPSPSPYLEHSILSSTTRSGKKIIIKGKPKKTVSRLRAMTQRSSEPHNKI